MRFAFAGCDRNLGIFEEFLAAGWEPVRIFSVTSPEPIGANQALLGWASMKKIPVQLERLGSSDLINLADTGCDALIIGSYNFRIPEWSEHLKYAVNFHPSPLPFGRGPYPIVNAILYGYQQWGVSCHKIDMNFDTGAVLGQEEFKLDEFDTHESLSLKIQIAFNRLAKRIANQFDDYWSNTHAQAEGDYWPLFSIEDRTINYNSSVFQIRRQFRAFGKLGCFARMGNSVIQIFSGYAWPETHSFQPGQPILHSGQTMLLACADGYVAFSEWSPLPAFVHS